MVLSIDCFAFKNSQPAFGSTASFNVFFEGQGIREDGETYHAMGNGSLIAPDLVVTSAHCLAGSMKQLDSITVQVGAYIARSGPYGSSNDYHRQLDKVKIKKVYFLKSIDAAIRAGKLTGVNSIPASDDIAIIKLERPIDSTKVAVQPIPLATIADYEKVVANSSKYTYTAVSINVETSKTQQTKRYVQFSNMALNTLLNLALSLPMWSTDLAHRIEPGDSGAPLLVNVGGAWKLFALSKGEVRNGLSAKMDEWWGLDTNITARRSIFTPLAPKICQLLVQVGKGCN